AGEAVGELDAVAVAVVRHPVGLQLDDRPDHHGTRERPVDVLAVELVDDVADADGDAQRDAREQMNDAQLPERISHLGQDGRLDVRVGQACDFAKGEHGRTRLPAVDIGGRGYHTLPAAPRGCAGPATASRCAAESANTPVIPRIPNAMTSNVADPP